MNKQTCETCRFLGGRGQFYDCRRHAPISFAEQGGVLVARWPQVESHQSCGDHERSPSSVPTSFPVVGGAFVTGVTVSTEAPKPPPCTTCGVPYEKHGSYPTCSDHPYVHKWGLNK